MADLVKILNTIRANASSVYQDRIPQATRDNLAAVGTKMGEHQDSMNEFLNLLVNRIAMVIVNQKMIKNPLAQLKRGGLPMGKDIEEIFVNPAISESYTYTSEDLLKPKTPDVKALYYGLNRQDKYSVTITKPELMKAIVNDSEMNTLIANIVNSLYSGDNLDEFILMKQLVAQAYKAGHAIKKVMPFRPDELTADNAKALVTEIQTDSSLFEFAGSDFNSYKVVKPAGDKGKDVITYAPLNDQIILIDSRILTKVSIDVLAMAFNMNKVDFMANVIKVDNFNGEPIMAALVDRNWFKVMDVLKETSSFFNADNLSYKYYLHHWEVIQYSMFANAVFYCYTPQEVTQ